MTAAQRILAATGVGTAAFGAWLLASDLPLGDLFALAAWLAAAIVVHDGLVVPVAASVRRLLRRSGHGLPPTALRAIEIGLTVGGVLTLFVAAELWAQGRGSANPTILTGAYGLRLALVWLGIGVVVSIVAAIAVRRAGRAERPRRPSEDQSREA